MTGAVEGPAGVETDGEPLLPVLYVSPERFRRSPQVGLRCVMSWPMLVTYLSRPTIGDAKDGAGAWSPAAYRDDMRRLDHLESIHALVLDVDECGETDRVADLLVGHEAVVHATFSSTPDAPRCRIVLRLTEGIDAATYERAHLVARAQFARVGVVADLAAKDAARLSYSPVVRPGAAYAFRSIAGRPLDGRAVASVCPKPRAVPRPSAPRSGSRYAVGALNRAAQAVASAPDGTRNATLNREAYALARLPELPAATIAGTLHEAGRAAGLGEREIAKTIGSALRARRSA